MLRLMLDSHPNISCGPETHFLLDMVKIVTSRWEQVSRFAFPEDYWYEKIRNFYSSFQTDYMIRRGKSRWAEKTPMYTLHLDFIDRLFPTAQYLHLVRNGRDVVASHRDRWGFKAAARSVSQWVKYITLARVFGHQKGPDRYHELRYEQLVLYPERQMRQVLTFLVEPWDDALLDYERQQHDGWQLIAEKRRQEAGSQATIYTHRVGMGREANGLLLNLLFDRHARSLQRELGYE